MQHFYNLISIVSQIATLPIIAVNHKNGLNGVKVVYITKSFLWDNLINKFEIF